MDIRAKLTILADAAKYDASCGSGGSKHSRSGGTLGATERMGICHSFTPDGRCVSLLKTLLTKHPTGPPGRWQRIILQPYCDPLKR